MKKKLLFLMLSVLTLGAWAEDVTAVVDNISSYSGTASYVYNNADGKVYARNTSGSYEVYGIYEKVAATQIDYIATDDSHQTYINTGYIHKANTRVVADIMMTSDGNGWQAVFGARKDNYKNNAFVLFSTSDHNGNHNGVFNRSGIETDFNNNIPANERIIIEASGQTATVKKQSDNSEIASATTTGTADAGLNPMFIFNTNTNNGSGATPDGSYNKMRLYSFKIYEGDVLVHDYVPVATSIGKGGLRDNQTGDILFSAKSDVDFVKSSDVTVAAYNGKMSVNLGDGKVYRYNGTSYVEVGSLTLGSSISDTDYKNMKNWRCPDDHWASVFGSGDKITYDAEAGTNSFNPYEGNGGWEPLHRTISVEANAYYNVSFKYSTSGWNTWNTNHSETPDPISLPFKIIDRESYNQNLGFYTDAGLIAYAKLTNQAVTNQDISVNFTSTTNVARFIIQFGVVDDGSHSPNYTFSFDNWDVKKYDYPENYPIVNFESLINSLIDEVNDFDTDKTTDALATALSTAKTNASNSLDDEDDLAGQLEALEALQTAFDNAQSVDASILRATVTLAEEEGVSHSAADGILSTASTQEAIDNELSALRIARKRHYAEKRSETFTGSAPEAGKDYYLYNVGQRQFLGGGNDHGTKLSMVYASNAMTLEADGDKFKINTHRITSGRSAAYVGTDEYVDAADGASFTFTEETSSGSKTYTISYETGKYLGYKANTYNRVVIDNTDANSTDNHWKLISKAEFDALQNTATVSNPVDATYLISNPGYERGMERGDWTYVGCSTEGLNDNYQNDTNYPDYVVTGNDGGEISVSRTLTGLKPGIYKVSVQACYRDGWNAACAWNHYNGTQHRNAKLIAGNKVADIKTLAECGGKVPGITTNLDNASLEAIIGGFPDTGPEAAEFFEVGQFWTSVDNVQVGSDGQLTIAVKRESGDHIDGDWVAVDNWRLTYYGPEPWNGTDDAILPSIKYGGSYSAYTWTRDSGVLHPNNDVNYEHFNEIVGVPANDSSDNAWYATDYVPSFEWTFGNSVLPSSWSSNYGDIYVRRPFVIAAGSTLPSTVYMPAPHDDAPCEYYINGTLVWSRTGSEPSVDGWNQDEVVRLTDEQKALIKTDGTVNVFAFHVHQNWGGRYADGGLYGNAETNGTPSKVFVSNETRKRLENAVNEAEAEGLSANADVIRAKASLNWLQDASYNLEKIRYVIRQHNALKHDYSTLASAEPSDGLEVYIYNVGAGMFLAGGNDWGTHMSLRGQMSYWPMKLHANSSKSGRYSIQSNLPNGARGTDDGMGHNGYVDCNRSTDFTTSPRWGWDFEEVGDGSYRIINCGEDGTVTDKYLGMTEDYRFQVETNKTGADNVYNHWKIFTKAQLDALLTTATPSNPADASYYIHQATFQQNDFEGDSKGEADANFSKSKWSATLGGIYNWKSNDVSGDYAYEYYNNPNSTTSIEVKLSQTVTGLPAGLYRVTCNGLYRYGGHSAALAAGSCDSKAYLYAGTTSNKVLLPSIFDGKNKGAGYGNLDGGVDCIIPNGPGDAVRFFQNGQYLVSIDVEVGDDGECEIGMIRPAEDANSGEWMCVDNFQMTYLGPTSESVTVTSAGYATYCSNHALDFTGKDIKAYVGTKTGDKLTFTPITQVPANTGLLLVYEGGKTEDVPVIASATPVENNCLVGVNEETTINSEDYILNKVNDGGAGFYKAGSFTTLGAHKAYIPAAVGGSVKGFTISLDDDATAIEVVNGQSSMVNGSIYNLAGQRLSKTQKGINIVNGKKIMVK